jgi:hypothetical protein
VLISEGREYGDVLVWQVSAVARTPVLSSVCSVAVHCEKAVGAVILGSTERSTKVKCQIDQYFDIYTSVVEQVCDDERKE